MEHARKWRQRVACGDRQAASRLLGTLGVTESGLYLLDVDAEPRPEVEFYSFATRRITPVLSLEKKPSPWQPSLSASRDGRTVFYSQSDPQSAIKMVENFR